jgi:hypothetical protein
MMRPFTFIWLGLVCLPGCEQGINSGCRSVSESVYVNERFPADTAIYSPDSARVFMFEYDFNESISLSVNNNLIAQADFVTTTAGLAGRLVVKAKPTDEIVISTTNGCAHFKLRDGYKYLYINRLNNKDWRIAYSNYGRGYF